MDADRFDALSRHLSAYRSRRSLLIALLGSLLGMAAAAPVAGRRERQGRLTAQGPCGNGSAKANTCTRHRQCCTRICDRKANRCRCRRQGQVCRQDRHCCPGGQDLACIRRRCWPRVGTGTPFRVFVTSRADLNGNLGGLDGADTICQDLAEAANLPGTYRAWLSDAVESPATRFERSPGHYVLVDETLLAANWRELTSGRLRAPIDLTEQEIRASEEGVAWTNTTAEGRVNGAGPNGHCRNWVSNSEDDKGNGGFINPTPQHPPHFWTEGFGGYCGTSDTRLYCFQQS